MFKITAIVVTLLSGQVVSTERWETRNIFGSRESCEQARPGAEITLRDHLATATRAGHEVRIVTECTSIEGRTLETRSADLITALFHHMIQCGGFGGGCRGRPFP